MTERTTAGAVNSALNSEGGKFAWTVAKVAVTILMTTLMTISTSILADLSRRQTAQEGTNTQQELAIQSLQQLTTSQQRVIDANSLTMQSVGQQVLRNTDSIEHTKDLLQQYVQRGPR